MNLVHLNEIAVVWIGDACKWRPETVRRAYELIVKSWSEAGVEPQQLAAFAPGVGKRYGAFRQKRRFVEKARFENIEMLAFGRLFPGFSRGCTRWEMEADISPKSRMFVTGCVPSLVGAAANVVRDSAHALISLSECRYAYMVRQKALYSPSAMAYGICIHVDDDWRHEDSRYNIQNWSLIVGTSAALITGGILRNVFPENYLSEFHLRARLGRTGTTLKDWIQADPTARGTLERFSNILTKWTPPVERIPQIREELYRAGRVFYWRFVIPGTRHAQGDMTPEPFHRPDLSAPWEAPEPIPEIYRADYWKDKDPSLTY